MPIAAKSRLSRNTELSLASLLLNCGEGAELTRQLSTDVRGVTKALKRVYAHFAACEACLVQQAMKIECGSCSTAGALAAIERRFRERVSRESRETLRLACAAAALEIQRERFNHQAHCLHCRRAEGRVS